MCGVCQLARRCTKALMAELVVDFVLDRLREWGVQRVYGYPGDGINGFLGAFDRADGEPEFIQTRHEEMAAFMACGPREVHRRDRRLHRDLGPGRVHLLNGLYDAKLDHQPVLAIVGQQKQIVARRELPAGGRPPDALQGRLQVRQTCATPAQARHLIDRGHPHGARPARRRDAHLPGRRAGGEGGRPRRRGHGAVFSCVGYSRPRIFPQRVDLEAAAEILNAGEKVAMLDRPGRAGRRRRGRRDRPSCSAPGSRRRCSARRAAGRPAVRDRPDRPARLEAELRDDGELRLPVHGRDELPVRGVAAEGGPGAARRDRPRRADDRHPLPHRRRSSSATRRRRSRRCAAARAQGRPQLARGDREERRGVVARSSSDRARRRRRR